MVKGIWIIRIIDFFGIIQGSYKNPKIRIQNQMPKTILIVTPDIKMLGGVANHYLGLKQYWKQEVNYIYYGKRLDLSLPAFILLLPDLFNFLIKLISKRPDVVIINPSLRKYQLFRDGLYLIIAKIFKIKVITFFHGWDFQIASQILNRPKLFRMIYGKSDLMYVLCQQFKDQLLEIGVTSLIHLTTTKVDDKLISEFDINQKSYNKSILFLARIEENKGILIALEAFKLVQKNYPEAIFKVAGNGSALKKAIELVEIENIKNVEFLGSISGKKLIETFKESSIYILPTHGEGMPTSVLEAMAFGLPIVTRPVGGLNDFFEEGKMGNLVESLVPVDYASAITALIKQEKKSREIGMFNHKYALDNFLASTVARKIEADIDFLQTKFE